MLALGLYSAKKLDKLRVFLDVYPSWRMKMPSESLTKIKLNPQSILDLSGLARSLPGFDYNNDQNAIIYTHNDNNYIFFKLEKENPDDTAYTLATQFTPKEIGYEIKGLNQETDIRNTLMGTSLELPQLTYGKKDYQRIEKADNVFMQIFKASYKNTNTKKPYRTTPTAK